MRRRDFLRFAVKLFITVAGILVVPFLFSLGSFRLQRKEIKYFFISYLDELPRRDIKIFELNLEQQDSRTTGSPKNRNIFGGTSQVQVMNIYIVKRSDGWIALSPVCTHLGCIVKWNRIKKEFVCPCHGGRYSMDGEVIGGPPPLPLMKLPLKIEDERVFVGLRV
ncbi:MAG: ubiquinol-cytochrome c reductase iron-sulfur subunit [Thermodesulfovibrionales bacterium]